MSGWYCTPVAQAPKTNRGPSAGPENRAALIAAARAVFDEQGVSAPLSAVARRAGVGQGSLYRHFPDRVSLATAAFEQNMEQIEALAASPSATLRDLCELVTQQTEGVAAFIALVFEEHADARVAVFEQRLRALLASKWDARAGLLGPSATLDDLMLAMGMVASVVMQSPHEARHDTSAAAWDLVQRGLKA